MKQWLSLGVTALLVCTGAYSSLAQQTLTVRVLPSGSGTAQIFNVTDGTSFGPGGTVADPNANAGNQIEITAAPNAGNVFVGWENLPPGATVTGTEASFSAPGNNLLVTARMKAAPRTVLAQVNNPARGGVRIENSDGNNYPPVGFAASAQDPDFDAGETVTIRQQAAPGFAFANWTGAPAGLANNEQLVIPHDGDNYSVTANFVASPTITVAANGPLGLIAITNLTTGAAIAPSANGFVPVANGDIINIVAIPAAGGAFSTWSGALPAGLTPTVRSLSFLSDGTARSILAEFISLGVDTDGDGIPDAIELQWGLDPEDPADALEDPDSDGLTNLEELTPGRYGFITNPFNPDTDGDGMRDGWEAYWGLDPTSTAFPNGANDNPDGDFLWNVTTGFPGMEFTNIEEYDNFVANKGGEDLDPNTMRQDIRDNSTDPFSEDTDEDGLPDGWEVSYGLNPVDAQGAEGAAGNPDGDENYGTTPNTAFAGRPINAFTNLEEYKRFADFGLGTTDPTKADTDEDGLPDGWENDFGLDPLSDVGDDGAEGNPDGDFVYSSETGRCAGDITGASPFTNLMEFQANISNPNVIGREGATSHPLEADVDGDMLPDGWEVAFGYDPWFRDTDGNGTADGDENPDGDWMAFDPDTGFRHIEVKNAYGFDPRTAWTNKFGFVWQHPGTPSDSPFTKEYTNIDELLGLAGTDTFECNSGSTHPLRFDTDGDGIPDGWELYVGLDPQSAEDAGEDPDNDGLSSLQEYENAVVGNLSDPTWQNKIWPTDPFDGDTDGDQISDGGERSAFNYSGGEGAWMGHAFIGGGLNPTSADTDGDRIPDAWEREYASTTGDSEDRNGMDGTVWDQTDDYDGDGLLNYQEYWSGAVYHWQYEDWTPGRGAGGYDPADLFSLTPKSWDWHFYADVDVNRNAAVVPWTFIEGVRFPGRTRFSTTSPIDQDSDGDTMDDYYEAYHMLNPLFGTLDLYQTKFVSSGFVIANIPNNDIRIEPHGIGSPAIDPDQDGLLNAEESLQPAVPGPDYHHTDPTPLWVSDPSYSLSFPNLYYTLGSVPMFWDTQNPPPTYLYSFEAVEGFDTDNDGYSDKAELQGNAYGGATDPLWAEDPIRHRQLYLDGASAARTRGKFFHGSQALANFTVEAWVRPVNPASGARQVIVERPISLPSGNPLCATRVVQLNFRLGISPTGLPFAEYSNSGCSPLFFEIVAGPERALLPDVWTHLAAVYDGDAARFNLYLNGDLVGFQSTGVRPATGWIQGNPGFVFLGPIVVGASDANPDGWVMGTPVQAGPRAGLLNSEPDLHSHFTGWIGEIRVWDGAVSQAALTDGMFKRFRQAEVLESLAQREEDPSAPAVFYLYNFDDLPDPDHDPIFPAGFDLLNGRPNDGSYPHVPWWATAADRSTVYNNYLYVPWIENTVAHIPLDPPADAPSISNAVPNTSNPYNFAYYTGLNIFQENHPDYINQAHLTFDPRSAALFSDLLPLRGARGDQDVPTWAGPGWDDFDGDGLPDWWEIQYGLDPRSAVGLDGPDGDRDGDGLSNLYEFLAGTNPNLFDTDGNGVSDANEDSDGDGLSNIDEQNIFRSDPGNPDTDDDGILDGVEANNLLPATADSYGFEKVLTSPTYSLSPRIHRSLEANGNRLVAPFSERFAFIEELGPDIGPVVEILSPAEGANIAVRFSEISGRIESDIIVTRASILVNGLVVADARVDEEGFFAETVIISAGVNLIEVIAVDQNGERGSDLVTVNGIFAPAAIRVTQTWSMPGDMDTWLIDPLGRHRGWTAAGPGLPENIAEQIPNSILDIDDITGTGPENITLDRGFSTNGAYEVWINNFSHSGDPVSTVRVLVNEGLPSQQFVEFTANVTTSDGNGTEEAAWRLITTVTMPEGTMSPPGRPVETSGVDTNVVTGNVTLPGWTVEAWVRPENANQTGAIASYVVGDGQPAYVVGLRDSRPFIRVRTSGGEWREALAGPLPPEKWSHLAFVYSEGQKSVRIHLHGILVSSLQLLDSRLTQRGVLHVDTGFSMPGSGATNSFTATQIDELRFWSRDRLGGLIGENMHVTVPPSPTLVANYRFDDGGLGIEDATRPTDRAYDLGNPPDLLTGAKPGPDGVFGTADDIPDGVGPDGHNDYVTARHAAPVYGDLDGDADGLPDWWELLFFNGLGVASEDTDGDGLSNLYEFFSMTNPLSPDSDGDGIADGSEDFDRDGLNNLSEQTAGSDPRLPDTDDDGRSDSQEHITSPINALSPLIDRVLSLDGSAGSYVEFPRQLRFLLDTWTIDAWVHPLSLPVGEATIVDRTVGPGLENYMLGIDGTGRPFVRFTPTDASAAVVATAVDPIPLSRWTHVSGSFIGPGELRLEVNGAPVRQVLTPKRPRSTGVGPIATRVGAGFHGFLDEVRIWSQYPGNRTLVDLQKPLAGADVGLVAYLRFDDGTNDMGTSGIQGLREGQVQDFQSGFRQDWRNFWVNSATLVGGASVTLGGDDIPVKSAEIDSDGDGLPDWWEILYGLNPFSALGDDGADGDPDGDGLTNLYEFWAGTNPRLVDTSGNGIPDGLEDSDGDGLSNIEEQNTHRTNPGLADTDDDGFPDNFEINTGFDPLNSLDPFSAKSLRFGDAGVFDGRVVAPERIDGVPTLRHNLTNWTVEVFVNPLALPTTDVSLVSRFVEADGKRTFDLGLTAGGIPYIRFEQANGTGVAEALGRAPVALGSWTHLSASYNGSQLRMLVDGVVVRTLPTSASPSLGFGDLVIGGSGFRGDLKEVRLWNVARPVNVISNAVCLSLFDQRSSDPAVLSVGGSGFLIEIKETQHPQTGLTLDVLTNWTVEAWIRTTDADGLIVAHLNGQNNVNEQDDFNYFLGLQGGRLLGRYALTYLNDQGDVQVNTGVNNLAGILPVNDGQWHHVAYVRNPTNASLYIDGVLDARQPALLVPIDEVVINPRVRGFIGPTLFGRGMEDTLIDEARIWSRGISTQELREFKDRNLEGDEPGLVTYFNFDGQVGPFAPDLAVATDSTLDFGRYIPDASRLVGQNAPIVVDPLRTFRNTILSAYLPADDGGLTVEDFVYTLDLKHAGVMMGDVRFRRLSNSELPCDGTFGVGPGVDSAVPPCAIDAPLDVLSSPWTTGANISGPAGGWFCQDQTFFSGGAAMQSGGLTNSTFPRLPDNELSWLQTTVLGPGTICFHWQVSCEPPVFVGNEADYLNFKVDGVLRDRITGLQPWSRACFDVGEGIRTLRWEFQKDSFGYLGEDAAWIDNVIFTHTGVDTDGDGLSDIYETQIYGTDPLLWDTDGDGTSDGDEILLGTDPLVPDLPIMATITVNPQGQICLSWLGVVGGRYQVQKSYDMLTWVVAPTGFLPTEKSTQISPVTGLVHYCDPSSPETPSPSYRVLKIPN